MSWFVTNVTLGENTINFHVGVSGNSWTTKLLDSSGTEISRISGNSYGSFSLPRPTKGGTYNVVLWTGYGSSHDGEPNYIVVPFIQSSPPPQPPTPPGEDIVQDITDALNETVFKIGDTEIKKSYLLTAGIIITAAYFLLKK